MARQTQPATKNSRKKTKSKRKENKSAKTRRVSNVGSVTEKGKKSRKTTKPQTQPVAPSRTESKVKVKNEPEGKGSLAKVEVANEEPRVAEAKRESQSESSVAAAEVQSAPDLVLSSNSEVPIDRQAIPLTDVPTTSARKTLSPSRSNRSSSSSRSGRRSRDSRSSSRGRRRRRHRHRSSSSSGRSRSRSRSPSRSEESSPVTRRLSQICWFPHCHWRGPGRSLSLLWDHWSQVHGGVLTGDSHVIQVPLQPVSRGTAVSRLLDAKGRYFAVHLRRKPNTTQILGCVQLLSQSDDNEREFVFKMEAVEQGSGTAISESNSLLARTTLANRCLISNALQVVCQIPQEKVPLPEAISIQVTVKRSPFRT